MRFSTALLFSLLAFLSISLAAPAPQGDEGGLTFRSTKRLYRLDYSNYTIQPSAKHVLFSANFTRQLDHSYSADYYVWSVEAKTLIPLVVGQRRDVQYTLRFSPDGEYLAFLRFNQTGVCLQPVFSAKVVPTSTLPYYMGEQEVAPVYPEEHRIKYTKPGEKLPIVTFNLLEVNNPSVPRKVDFQTYALNDLVIPEVAWVAEKHERVIFRVQGRTQDTEKLVLVDVESGIARVVRERDATDGWLDRLNAIKYAPRLSTPSYVDISDHSGWAHIYLYPVAGGDPIALTSGNWEVTTIYSVDTKRHLVYYQSTERDSTERHIFSVSLNGKTKRSLVDITKEGYYDASPSPGRGYYILSYLGPNLSWQELRRISPDTPIRVINDHVSLKNKLSGYALPKTSWSTLKHPDGYELNFFESLPPKFRKGVKYPVLFYIYGGPGSQETGKTFRQTVNIFSYLGPDPELEYIVVTVDNRGTGNKGRKFRSLVTGRLGKLEAEDQVWAAREYAKRDYVDGKEIAIWGASYGGYLTGKVLELDSGAFSSGVMSAPVTDWRFYNFAYTERYMKLLATNPAGYNASAITKTAGFQNVAGGFLIQHGTGTDNVHFQNSAVLVDALVYEGAAGHGTVP
ncbi:dipeptidyl peptidase IV N-terminal region-domain-containing protein [Tuber brumale]|nr:dipeptidyl peptidase IV N-terminal region-domain-containing protein [Tuber brumale]